MTPQASSPGPTQARWPDAGEWLLVLGLAATLAWTTLGLGGYLAATMVVTASAVFGLAVLGGALWLARGSLILHRAAWLPVPFLVYALASVLWLAPAPWLAWREWLLWLQMWLVFVLVLHFGRGRRQTGVLVGTFVALGLAGVVMAAYQRYGDHDWIMLGRTQADQFAGRSAGMFGIPNSLAAFLNLMIPAGLVLACARTTGRWTKLAGGALVLLFGFAEVLSISRGGWISLALALGLWPLIGTGRWARRLVGAAAVLVAAGLGVCALYHFSGYARERIQPFLDGRFESSRPIIWKAGVEMWRDRPWLGGGAASYNMRFDQYRPAGFPNEPEWAHNDYLNTLCDYGVVGFALWLGAAVALVGWAWRAVARVPAAAPGWLGSREWRLGLFVGLLAFGLHLAVDFHTKIPALAFAAAVALALLLREEPVPSRPGSAGRAGWALIALALPAAWFARPRYRAEALRFEARKAMDRQARTGQGDLAVIIPAALRDFGQAVVIDPQNGQAWSDLAYATMQNWHVTKGSLRAPGQAAEGQAGRALALCAIDAEFWIRQGLALDMQARRDEAESRFRRALGLAPHLGLWWYYYAYHLSAWPGHGAEARRAVETCLSLDPGNSLAEALRRQLVATP